MTLSMTIVTKLGAAFVAALLLIAPASAADRVQNSPLAQSFAAALGKQRSAEAPLQIAQAAPPYSDRGVESFAAGSQAQYGDYPTSSGRYSGESYGAGSTYNNGPPVRQQPPVYDQRYDDRPSGGVRPGSRDYGEPYPNPDDRGRTGEYYEDVPPDAPADGRPGTYSQGEITHAGHKFFGSVSRGLASVIEYAFKRSGRPNGYILGEDGGGAFVAGLRYGEGRLHTRDAGVHKVYWQGPSVGYDFGAEGSKVMILVYNLRHPRDVYHRFAGVQGSAYLVGGVSIQFQKYGDVVMAPIRSGLGLRLGANVGYLKYTRRPTWNPF